MVMKKYILLKLTNGFREIVDLSKFMSGWFSLTYGMAEVLKTSDYILDLVELGDLVEGLDGTRITYVRTIESNDHLSSDGYCFSNGITCAHGDDIVAIYKKQYGGDYRMFKVRPETL